MSSIRVDTRQFKRAMDKTIEGVNIKASEAIKRGSLECLNVTSALTPVDTGTLRSGWEFNSISQLEGVVFNNVDYAEYVEKREHMLLTGRNHAESWIERFLNG